MRPNSLKRYQTKIAPIAKKMGVDYLALFGSFARGEATKTSDVDVLVNFTNGTTFDGFFDLEEELEKIFDKKIDLVTKKGLSKYVKPYIQNDLKVLYG